MMKKILIAVISMLLLSMLICEFIDLNTMPIFMIFCCFAMTGVIMITVMLLVLADERSADPIEKTVFISPLISILNKSVNETTAEYFLDGLLPTKKRKHLEDHILKSTPYNSNVHQ